MTAKGLFALNNVKCFSAQWLSCSYKRKENPM